MTRTIISIVIIFLTFFFAGLWLRKHRLSKRVFVLSGIAFFIADIFILCQINIDAKLHKNCFSILFEAKKVTSFAPVFENKICWSDINQLTMSIYKVLAILSPLAWSSFIFSLFPVFINGLYYYILRLFRSVYLFSELNENSLTLAKSLIDVEAKENKKCLCVFCNVSQINGGEFIEEAESFHFVWFKSPISKFVPHINTFHKWTYFSISNDQNLNLEDTKKILGKFVNKKKGYSKKVHLYLYSDQKDARLVISSANVKSIPVTIVNRNRYAANDLFFRHPLVEALRYSKKDISVLVIGAGKIGTEVIKNAIWSGQMNANLCEQNQSTVENKYTFKISVFDRDATNIGDGFFLARPEIKNNYDVSFIKTDVLTSDFESKLKDIHETVNYICVCLGNDDLNVNVALYLRRFFMRHLNSDSKPFIAVETKNDIKAAGVLEFFDIDKRTNPKGRNSNKLTEFQLLNYHLHSFANNSTIYSRDIIDSPLSELARNVHFEYESVRASFLGDVPPSISITDKSYYLSDSNMNSSQARILHIPAKLQILGFRYNYADGIENVRTCILQDIEEIKRKLSDENIIEKLAALEHERWVAYMRCEGWCVADIELAKNDKNLYRRTREKVHYCIRPWKEMDDVETTLGIEMKKYDRQIVKRLLYILGFDENLKKRERIVYEE